MALDSPQLYINRELSFLEFNRRVLAQAQDAAVPLLERVRFLAISCNNLDEFFEIRVAGLKQRKRTRLARQRSRRHGRRRPARGHPRRVTATGRRAVRRCSTRELLPALRREGIHLLRAAEWTAEQVGWLAAYFDREIEPVLTPLGLDPARPFPRIQNKSQNFIVELSGTDAFGRDASLAIVQVPRSLPRILRVPAAGPGAT